MWEDDNVEDDNVEDDNVEVDSDLLEEWEEEALQDAADIDKLLEEFNYTGSRHHY